MGTLSVAGEYTDGVTRPWFSPGLPRWDAMRLKLLTILSLVSWTVAFTGLAASARADSVSPPISYTKPSADGRFLFAMIAPGTIEAEVLRWNDQKAAEIRAIRQTYVQSGLYRNDGSNTPLWTVNWYAYDVDVASDGVHLVRHGPWASNLEQEAFSFFASGRLVRTVAISELVDLKFLLPHSVSHFGWAEEARLENETMHYIVRTGDGNSFIFDVRNGSIIQESRHARIKLWGGTFALVVVLALIALVVRRRRASRLPAEKPGDAMDRVGG